MSSGSPQQLERTIGTGGAVLLGLGSIVGTGVFVSIALATTQTGPWILVAIAIATVTATCNGLSSAQLAAVYPVSGGTYEYANKLVSPAAGFSAGWMFLCAKSTSAAAAVLGAASYLLAMTGMEDVGLETPVAIALLALITVTVLLGLRRSVMATLITLAFAAVGLLVFFLACLDSGPSDEAMLQTPSAAGIPVASALMFVAFTGYGRVATLGEEVRDPARSIPRAVIMTLICAGILYMAVGWALSSTAMPEDLETGGRALDPLHAIATRIWGTTAGTIVGAGAIAAMIGVVLNLLLGLSRVVLAMARRGDMPRLCGWVWTRTSTPWVALLEITFVIGILVVIGDFTLAWSLSAFTVLIYYALTNLSALRLPVEHRTRPRWIAGLGLLLCCSLAFSVPTATWSIGIAVLLTGFIWRWILHRFQHAQLGTR